MMNDRGKSDRSVIPEKPPNNADNHAAEVVEGRDRAKGNSPKRNKPWTLSQPGLPSALERVGQAARQDRKLQFTALLHHIYDVDRLRRAYLAIEHDAAAGIGETWRHYGENLRENLQDLSGRLARGAYRARPVRRAYIEKADGRKRPLGVPVLEDKIVQRSAVEVLNAIYEVDFLGFSYGFRPQRSQHQALDAVAHGVWKKRVNWILDADLQSFFDHASYCPPVHEVC
jgi:RNA-directed DNA polymerase